MGHPLISAIVIDGQMGLSFQETLESVDRQQYNRIELVIGVHGSSEPQARADVETFIGASGETRFEGVQFVVLDDRDSVKRRFDAVVAAAQGEILCFCMAGDAWDSEAVFGEFAEKLSEGESVEGVCFERVYDMTVQEAKEYERIKNSVVQMVSNNDRWSLSEWVIRDRPFPVMGTAFSRDALNKHLSDADFESNAFTWLFFYQLVFSGAKMRFAESGLLLANSPDPFYSWHDEPPKAFFEEARVCLESMVEAGSYTDDPVYIEKTQRTIRHLSSCVLACDKGISVLLSIESMGFAKSFLDEFFLNPLPNVELVILCHRDDAYEIIDATNEDFINSSWCRRIRVINSEEFTVSTAYSQLLPYATGEIIIPGGTSGSYQARACAILESEDPLQVRRDIEAGVQEEEPAPVQEDVVVLDKEKPASKKPRRKLSPKRRGQLEKIADSSSLVQSVLFVAVAVLALALYFLSGSAASPSIVQGLIFAALGVEVLLLILKVLASAILTVFDE